LLLDEAAHGEHLVAHALEIFVEAPHDVMREIRLVHATSPGERFSGS
jgi:hypothetical protein